MLTAMLLFSTAYKVEFDVVEEMHTHSLFDVVIDVRNESEWNTGHIANAFSIPMGTFSSSPILNYATDCRICVYCHSGKRAEMVASMLLDHKFSSVCNGEGVSNAKDAKLVIEKSPDIPVNCHQNRYIQMWWGM